MMNLLGISGSLSATSSNTALLRAMAELTLPGTEEVTFTLQIYDGMEDIPPFRPDRDTTEEDAPPSVRDLRNRVRAANGVIFSTPEYAHNLPGSLKNALDWLVSSGDFDAKPVVILSASPSEWGGDKALASLLQTLRVLGANIPPNGTLAIPFVRRKIDAEGRLTDGETRDALRGILQGLVAQEKSADG